MLVLQHIACDPPGVYEDVLRDGSSQLLATSPAYTNQAFRWGRAAYGLQFQLEVSTERWLDLSVRPP